MKNTEAEHANLVIRVCAMIAATVDNALAHVLASVSQLANKTYRHSAPVGIVSGIVAESVVPSTMYTVLLAAAVVFRTAACP